MFGDDIGGLNRIGGPSQQFGIIGSVDGSAPGVGQAVTGQDALNGRYRRQGVDAQSFEFGANGAMPDQPVAGLEGLARFESGSLRFLVKDSIYSGLSPQFWQTADSLPNRERYAETDGQG